MPRKKEKNPKQCPSCGTIVSEPEKTWSLTSPLPDARGRITVTVMGSFHCPECGYRWRTVISKIKGGGADVEIEGASKKKSIEAKTESKPEIIELDLESILEEED